MAKPIKDTPVLKGEDAVRFYENMKKFENERIDKKTRQQIKDDFDKLKAIADF